VLPPNLEMPTSAATAQTLLIGAQYPFAISFLVWGLLYAYRERNTRYEEKLESMFSAGHGFGVGTLCLLSICGHVDETWTIAFTWAYFALDTWKMWRKKQWLFVLHHMLTIGSLVLTLGSTIMLEHRLSSYMLLIEWSAIPLNIWWEDKGNATKYKVLVGSYFVNRVIYLTWLLYLSKQCAALSSGDSAELCILWLVRLIHVANFAWWINLVRVGRAGWMNMKSCKENSAKGCG